MAKRKKSGHRERIVCAKFDDVCDDIFENGKLSRNAACMQLLKASVAVLGVGYAKRRTFEEFSALLDASPSRSELISQIVASWWHINYDVVRLAFAAELDGEPVEPAEGSDGELSIAA